MPQLGSLGAGNHFLEIQVVEEIYDQNAAEVMELEAGQVTVMIHTGSRGLGYQICDDYVKNLVSALSKYHIDVPDRQLACAPIESKEEIGRAHNCPYALSPICFPYRYKQRDNSVSAFEISL